MPHDFIVGPVWSNVNTKIKTALTFWKASAASLAPVSTTSIPQTQQENTAARGEPHWENSQPYVLVFIGLEKTAKGRTSIELV